ncbi:hypothetical protein D0817_15725 [Flavobacterium cupreum]|uniref:Uncharacterized protein n=1 Tax=Flavobacterium cupreum TaxID=2133766 RepID=A0A434A5L0_9FLAO|nr:hypothetical protein [Flavobacterium cupreum]RUT69617.1 hypothetical protein D0817_15725 [Flavobacterium cupreum]
MEKQNSNEYGHTDPDFIDQNTLVDGNTIENEDQFRHKTNTEQLPEFGESDPDYIDQNTPVDPDNYAKDEDPYQYQEEFIKEMEITPTESQNHSDVRSENDPDDESITNDDDDVINNEDEEEEV